MVYPTPGFVVRQTFLEFEPQGQVEEECEEARPLRRRHRSYSDTDLVSKDRLPSQFGSEELRLYCEQRKALRIAAEAAEQSEQETAEPTSPRVSEKSMPATPVDSMSEVGSPETPDEATEATKVARLVDSSSDGGLPDTPEDDCTTITLSNLPIQYSRAQLVETLDCEGFACTYDFMFLPMDLRTRTGNGYALVNFRSNADARRAIAHFDCFLNWKTNSSEVCDATWSRYIQGLPSLIERYRNSPVMHEAVPDIYKPALFGLTGIQEIFPEPTKRIRMPRLRRKAAKDRGNANSDVATSLCAPNDGSGWNSAETRPALPGKGIVAQGGNRRKKVPSGVPLPGFQDAWFVDLVASRAACQDTVCGAVAAPYAQMPKDRLPFPTWEPKACGEPCRSPLIAPSSVPCWLGRGDPTMAATVNGQWVWLVSG